MLERVLVILNEVPEKSIIKNSILNLVYTILNILFPLIMMTYASRVLGPDGIGRADYSKNIVSYFILLATLGLPTYGVREIARARVGGENLNATFTELFLINAVTTAISCTLFLVLIFSPIAQSDRAVLLCSGVQLFFNFANIDWLYQGLEQYAYIVVRSITIKILSVISIILFVRTRDDYILYALITSVALAGNYIFNLLYSRKYVRFDFRELHLKKHFVPLFYFGAALIFSSIYSKIDITMLGTMRTKGDVGIYSNAFQIVSVAACVSTSISTVFLPRLSLFYSNDRKRFDELLQFGIRIISFLVFPILTGLCLLAPAAVNILFGDAFAPSVSVIRILSVLLLVRSFGDLLCYRLCIATGHEKDRLPVYAGASVINIILNALLIPRIGCNGAALASVACEVYLNTTLFFKMKKVVGFRFPLKPINQNICAAIIMAGGILVVLKLEMNIIVKLLLSILMGIVIYFVACYCLKVELLRKDIKLFQKQ